jgi:hypothetical protein
MSGDGLGNATAGEAAVVRVHAVDACGNALLPHRSGGLKFGISLAPHAASQSQRVSAADDGDVGMGVPKEAWGVARPAAAETKLDVSGEWVAEGLYELRYTCSASGSYGLRAWATDADGRATELSASPFALEVAPHGPSSERSTLQLDGALASFVPSQSSHSALPPTAHSVPSAHIDCVAPCALQVPSLHALTAGSRLEAAVRVVDRFGNPTVPQAGVLTLCLVGPNGRSEPRMRHAASDAMGLYTISQALVQCGEYTLHAMVNGEEVPDL